MSVAPRVLGEAPAPVAAPKAAALAEDAVLGSEAAVAALERGPRGALVVSAIAVSLLVIGWLVFYFLLFLPRGAVG